MPKLFAKLCKNAIFPLTSSSSSSRRRSRSHTSNSNVYETSPRQNVNSNHQPVVLQENPIQREPPPPYWEHHNHRVLVQQQQQNQEQHRPPPPTPPTSPPAVHNHHLNNVHVRNNVQIQFNDTSDDGDDDNDDDDDDIYSDFEYNYAIRNNLNYSDDIFCPDLVRNCAIANDDNSSIEPDTNTADNELLLANLSRVTINNEHNDYNNAKEDTKNNDNQVIKHQMGQNLSLRRPKISLTWVLREQNTNPQQHPQTSSTINNNNKNDTPSSSSSLKLEPTLKPSGMKKKKQSTTSSVEVPKYQSAQPIQNQMIVVAPAVAAPPIQSNLANNKNINNNNNNNKTENVLTLSELKLRAANYKLSSEPNELLRTKLCENQSDILCNNSSVHIKSTYSEPSLYTTVSSDTNNCINSNVNNINNNNNNSNAQRHRHRQRKRKDRNRSQRFGYEIKNVDEFLSKCSLTSPANIPVVLSASSTLYQTRPGGYQIELPLPLGMVVNAVFKNQNWLYVQTPHAEEGYVNYSSCLPLGILPPIRSSPTSRPPPCWENSGDVFPRPCGNMTDSEKEQLRCDRGGTRSEGARTPKLRRNSKICSERNVDALYLRAASQPKLADKSNYAQLKPTNKIIKPNNYSMSEYGGSGGGGCNSEKSNDEYISLHQPKHRLSRTISNSTNLTLLRQNYYHTNHHHHHRHPHSNIQPNGSIPKPMRQTLLAITENYVNSKIAVKKGDVVILISAKDFRIAATNQIKQWFYVKTRENICGLIPAEVAGHGFL